MVAGMVVCYLLGTIQGFLIGKNRKITKSEAAKVMAKASWKDRKPKNDTRGLTNFTSAKAEGYWE